MHTSHNTFYPIYLRATSLSLYSMTESEIKENIEKIRKERKITQQQMADLLNVDRNTYRNIEKGRSKIINPKLYNIAGILGISIKDICTDNYFSEREKLKEDEKLYSKKLHDMEAEYKVTIELLQKENADLKKKLSNYEEWLKDKDSIISFLKNIADNK